MSTALPGIVDPRVRRYVIPTRIKWEQGPVSDANALLLGQPQVTLEPTRRCILKPGGALVLDFGRELHGGVQLMSANTPEGLPVTLRLRFGESVSEAMGTPNQDHAIHDARVPVPRWGYTEFGNTAFRFVRIDLEQGEFVELHSVRAVSLMRDLPQLGSFRCNDQRLNEIWQTSVDTVHLCMQDFVWDGAKRDRLVWMGDLHPEMMVIATVFGAPDVLTRSLDLLRDTSPLPRWMNGIPSYSLWWLICQRDWYHLHADRAYLDAQRPYATALIAQALAHIGPDGAETFQGFRFIDWATANQAVPVHAGLQALLAWALRAGQELATLWGDDATVAACVAGLAKLRTHAAPAPGVKQVAALQALAGLLPAAAANAETLAVAPLQGLSPFFGYYILEARAQAGDYAGALDVIRRYWGGMLDRGATSFWEAFDLAWLNGAGRIDELTPTHLKDLHADFGEHCYQGLRHSLCHGWAGGPAAWLLQHVLGIQPATPGYATARIAPNLCDLEWAEGSLPTPHGLIHLRVERDQDGVMHHTAQLPPGVSAVG